MRKRMWRQLRRSRLWRLRRMQFMNTFGNIFRLTSFGESHGAGIGGVIDGMPAGIKVDMEFIQSELDRRKPGQSRLVTPRKEKR